MLLVVSGAEAFEPWTGPCQVVDAGASLDEVADRVLGAIDA